MTVMYKALMSDCCYSNNSAIPRLENRKAKFVLVLLDKSDVLNLDARGESSPDTRS